MDYTRYYLHAMFIWTNTGIHMIISPVEKKPMASKIYWSPYVCLGFPGKKIMTESKSMKKLSLRQCP